LPALGWTEDEGRSLTYVAQVDVGFTPALRESRFKQFRGLQTKRCPFGNLPKSCRGRWGEGLTGGEMEKCRCLKPRIGGRSSTWKDNHEALATRDVRGLTANSAFKVL
jgi:hypothetical protein